MINLGIFDLKKWVHVKHISEISEDDQEKAAELRGKLCEIFKTCASLTPEEFKLQMREVNRLTEEIEKLGFFVDIQFSIKNVGEYFVLMAEIGFYALKTKTVH